MTQQHPPAAPDSDKTGPKEIIWFVGLWAAGVSVIAIIGGAIKLALG